MSFSKNDVKKWLEKDIENMSSLYQKKYINYREKTSDSREHCYDVIAEYLKENLNLFNKENIRELKRENYSYKTPEHTELDKKEKALIYKQKRGEEWFARSLLFSKINNIGEIIDYQTPIKSSDRDKGVGEIDLLAYDDEEKTLSLIELKREYNTETILRAILEISTYRCQIFDKKLITDFKKPPETTIQKIVLIFRDSKQHEDFKNSKQIRELAEKLKVKVFILDYKASEAP